MPRKPRLEIVGLPHHVTQRGVDQQPVFFDRKCHLDYLELLTIHSRELNVSVHGWCLMTNHVHLLLTPNASGSLSRLMQNINRTYVQRVNKRFQRTGHLWAGRFKSSLVDSDQYLFSCMRYIELNSVRAGLVKHPQAYPWSSWHANVGARKSRLITPHPCYLALGKSDSARHESYRTLVLEHEPEHIINELRAATRQNAVFGSERFARQIQQMAGREVCIKSRGRPENC